MSAFDAVGLAKGVSCRVLRTQIDRDHVSVEGLTEEPFRTMAQRLHQYRDAVGMEYIKPVQSFADNQVEQLLIGRYQAHLLEPLFEQALEDRDITAWVAYNDGVDEIAGSVVEREITGRLPEEVGGAISSAERDA